MAARTLASGVRNSWLTMTRSSLLAHGHLKGCLSLLARNDFPPAAPRCADHGLFQFGCIPLRGAQQARMKALALPRSRPQRCRKAGEDGEHMQQADGLVPHSIMRVGGASPKTTTANQKVAMA